MFQYYQYTHDNQKNQAVNHHCHYQVVREIPIPESPFPIPDFLKTQKMFKNPGIFPEFPLEKNRLKF